MEKEQAIFNRKLLYRQSDKQYSEQFDAEISAQTSIWIFSWMLEGMTHPISMRAKIGIIYDQDNNDELIINPYIEFWKNDSWTYFDEMFMVNNKLTVEESEKEALYRIESFLMGVGLDEVKERYGETVEEPQEPQGEEESESEEYPEENKNVLSFKPK